jgi:hypothetical protein
VNIAAIEAEVAEAPSWPAGAIELAWRNDVVQMRWRSAFKKSQLKSSGITTGLLGESDKEGVRYACLAAVSA